MAGEPSADEVCWPLRRLHAILEDLEGPNDGLVSTESAVAFGTPLPAWPLDHLRQMNWLAKGYAGPLLPVIRGLYATMIENLAHLESEPAIPAPATETPSHWAATDTE